LNPVKVPLANCDVPDTRWLEAAEVSIVTMLRRMLDDTASVIN
jgi:hypothetical protein